MKQELLNSINLTLYKISNITVRGEESVSNMRDSFTLLHGMAEYVSKLPDDPEETDEAEGAKDTPS